MRISVIFPVASFLKILTPYMYARCMNVLGDTAVVAPGLGWVGLGCSFPILLELMRDRQNRQAGKMSVTSKSRSNQTRSETCCVTLY